MEKLQDKEIVFKPCALVMITLMYYHGIKQNHDKYQLIRRQFHQLQLPLCWLLCSIDF